MSSDPVVRARELAAAATPGPWATELEDGYYEDTWRIVLDEPKATTYHYIAALNSETQVCDAQFIAESRELVPVLCDIIDELRTEYKMLIGARDRLNQGHQRLHSENRELEELNARLTAALREGADYIDENGDDSSRVRALLAEVSKEPQPRHLTNPAGGHHNPREQAILGGDPSL